jgi:ribose 5-phosphate isomerase B
MRISLGSDHGGLELKNHLVSFLKNNGHEVIDYGTDCNTSCDYPDFAYKAACAIRDGLVDYGIVICTTGIGVSIVANKVLGVRCSLVTNVIDAVLTKEHNDSNCLALGQKNVSKELAEEIVTAWLNASFTGGRHERRVEKIKAIEVGKYE